MQAAPAMNELPDEGPKSRPGTAETHGGQSRRRGRTTPPLKRCLGLGAPADDRLTEDGASSIASRKDTQDNARRCSATDAPSACPMPCASPTPPPTPSAGRFTGRRNQFREGQGEDQTQQPIVLQLSEMAGLKPQGQEVHPCALQAAYEGGDNDEAIALLEQWKDPTLLSGWRFSKKPLGEGSTAMVYKASRQGGDAGLIEGSESTRAVKIYGHAEALNYKGLVKEIEALRTAQGHPNIVRLHGVCRVDTLFNGEPRWALVFEHCTPDLFEVLTQGALDEDRCCELIYGIFSALAFLNSRSLIHRDVKLENILLNGWAQPLLTDFDAAVHLSDHVELQRRRGSPGYCAPEILCGHAYNIQCDCFSVGVCTYYLLTRTQPFSAPQEQNASSAVLKRTVEHEIDFDNDPLLHNLSKDARETMSICLRKDPRARPPAAKMMSCPWFWKIRKARGQAGPSAPLSAGPSRPVSGRSRTAGPQMEESHTAAVPPGRQSLTGEPIGTPHGKSKGTTLPTLPNCSEKQVQAAAKLRQKVGGFHAKQQQEAVEFASDQHRPSPQELEDILVDDYQSINKPFTAPIQRRVAAKSAKALVQSDSERLSNCSTDVSSQHGTRRIAKPAGRQLMPASTDSPSSGNEKGTSISDGYGRQSFSISDGYGRQSFESTMSSRSGGYGTRFSYGNREGDCCRPSFGERISGRSTFESRRTQLSHGSESSDQSRETDGLVEQVCSDLISDPCKKTFGLLEQVCSSRGHGSDADLVSDQGSQNLNLVEKVCSKDVFDMLTSQPAPSGHSKRRGGGRRVMHLRSVAKSSAQPGSDTGSRDVLSGA